MSIQALQNWYTQMYYIPVYVNQEISDHNDNATSHVGPTLAITAQLGIHDDTPGAHTGTTGGGLNRAVTAHDILAGAHTPAFTAQMATHNLDAAANGAAIGAHAIIAAGAVPGTVHPGP